VLPVREKWETTLSVEDSSRDSLPYMLSHSFRRELPKKVTSLVSRRARDPNASAVSTASRDLLALLGGQRELVRKSAGTTHTCRMATKLRTLTTYGDNSSISLQAAGKTGIPVFDGGRGRASSS
jgi:hypothetical protein